MAGNPRLRSLRTGLDRWRVSRILGSFPATSLSDGFTRKEAMLNSGSRRGRGLCYPAVSTQNAAEICAAGIDSV
jgi:hypothetical protein